MLMYAHDHLLKNSNAQLQPYNQTKFSTHKICPQLGVLNVQMCQLVKCIVLGRNIITNGLVVIIFMDQNTANCWLTILSMW
jgi:hypothetical protein